MLSQANSKLSVSDYCHLGDFKRAAEVLEGWQGVGLLPRRAGRTDLEYAEALQWAAVISVELSLSSQVSIGDSARDMLTTSSRLSGSHEPLVWLGICYCKTGEYHESEAVLSTCLDNDLVPTARFLALRNLAVVKTYKGEFDSALGLLSTAELLASSAPAIGCGKLHLQRGLIYRKLNQPDLALAEYEKAERYFEEAGSRNYEGDVLLNLARIFLEKNDLVRAHVHADRAVSIFESIDDKLHAAKAWDEIARIHFAGRKLERAERAARKAVSLVEVGDQSQVLAECLITLGTVLGERALIESEAVLSRAASLCAGLGDDTQEAHANDALLRILKNGKKLLSQISDQLRPLEYKMIKGALLRHNGVISRAALDLEMPYQTLIKKIQTQYQDLLPARRPIRNRRKSMLGSNSENLRKQ